MMRLLWNPIEDVLHPRPAFAVEVAGRKVKGRILTIGAMRDLTRAGAFDAVDALARADRKPVTSAELAEHLERLILIAAAGLRRSPAWVARRCTSEEVGQIVKAVMSASNPPAGKEGRGGPPA